MIIQIKSPILILFENIFFSVDTVFINNNSVGALLINKYMIGTERLLWACNS